MSAPSRCDRSRTLWEITTPEETADIVRDCYRDRAVIEALWQIWLRDEREAEDIRFWRTVIRLLGEEGLAHVPFTPGLAAMLLHECTDDPPRIVWAYLREAALEREHRRWAFWFEVMTIVTDPSCRIADTDGVDVGSGSNGCRSENDPVCSPVPKPVH